MTPASHDGGERGKASKSGKYLRILSTTLRDFSLLRPSALKTCLCQKKESENGDNGFESPLKPLSLSKLFMMPFNMFLR